MARLSVGVRVRNLNGGAAAVVGMAVDSTADHSILPSSLLADLGIVSKRRLAFALPDGSSREYDCGFANLTIEGDDAPCPVLFGPQGVYVLGASALAALNLEENPDGDGLAPARWLSLGDAFEDGDLTAAERIRAISVSPMDGYRIWLRYSDGTSGEVDLSDFAGHGVFSAWDDRSVFESVRLDECGAVVWGDDIDLCADGLYARLTGRARADGCTIQEPTSDKPLSERLDELERAGLIKVGTRKLPDYFWDLPRAADPEGTVLAALLEEREEGW